MPMVRTHLVTWLVTTTLGPESTSSNPGSSHVIGREAWQSVTLQGPGEASSLVTQAGARGEAVHKHGRLLALSNCVLSSQSLKTPKCVS